MPPLLRAGDASALDGAESVFVSAAPVVQPSCQETFLSFVMVVIVVGDRGNTVPLLAAEAESES